MITSTTLVMAISAPRASTPPAQAMPAPSRSPAASGGVAASQRVDRSYADGCDGHDDVEHRRDQQRADDRDGQVTTGVLGLLRPGRDGVEADICEEDHPGCSCDAGGSIGRERDEVPAVECA